MAKHLPLPKRTSHGEPARNTLPPSARAAQLKCQVRPLSGQGEETVDFPGASEELHAHWPELCWEISGVRALGEGYLTNFRLVLDCHHAQNEPLDISLSDVRNMHLEVPLGVIDTVALNQKAARIRQCSPIVGEYAEEWVKEVKVVCQDVRVVRIFGLEVVSEESGETNPIYSLRATEDIYELLCGSTLEPVKALSVKSYPGRRLTSRFSNWDGCFSFGALSGSSTPVSRRAISLPLIRSISNSSRSTPVLSRGARGVTHQRSKRSPRKSWLGRALDQMASRPNAGEVFLQSGRLSTLGWDIGEDAGAEFFARQGAPYSSWRLTEVNSSYELCDSYPRSLAVPKEASDELIKQAASARARRRVPVLTYFHKAGGSALLRCSQPAVKKRGAGAQLDSQYLELCRKAVHRYAALIIFDCRTEVAARANAIKGGGQEDPRDYAVGHCRMGDVESATVISLDVPNIHEMRASWQELRRLVDSSDVAENRWLQLLGDTQWLDHCRRITECALSIARALNGEVEGKPPACVVVHCSDGWDRTTQIVALAQLLTSARYRTRQGFAELVEKDWRRFGHRFADRCVTDGVQAAPIFIQWLFCVAAVVDQFPDEFEFDSQDLMLLADLRLSGSIGTFLFNSEREARMAQAPLKQISVWSVWLETNEEKLLEVTPGSWSFRRASWASIASPTSSRSVHYKCGELLLPVTSLKKFCLWDWTLRFDEVAFARLKVYSTAVGIHNPQRLGRRLVIMLRDSGAAECKSCKCDFGVRRWRHHCRGCGLLFCAPCVQWRARLAPPDVQSAWSRLRDGLARMGSRERQKLDDDELSMRSGLVIPEGPREKVCRRCFELSRKL